MDLLTVVMWFVWAFCGYFGATKANEMDDRLELSPVFWGIISLLFGIFGLLSLSIAILYKKYKLN